MAEYNAVLIALHIAQQLGIQHLESYCNSKLIINQVWGEYEVNWIYYQAVIKMANTFDGFYIDYVS